MKKIDVFKVCTLYLVLLHPGSAYSLTKYPSPGAFINRIVANYAGQYASKFTSSFIAIESINHLQRNPSFISLQNGAIIGSMVGLIDYSVRKIDSIIGDDSNIDFIHIELGNILRAMLTSYFSKYSEQYNIDPTLFLTVYSTIDYLISSYLFTFFSDQFLYPSTQQVVFSAIYAGIISVVSRTNSFLFEHYPDATIFIHQVGIAYAFCIAFIIFVAVARASGGGLRATG